MRKKLEILFLVILMPLLSYSQEVVFPEWGDFSEYEKNLKVYAKDTTANAVVLKEVGYSSIDDGGGYGILKKIYIRIKILKKEGFDQATDINENSVSYLDKEAIYRTKTPKLAFLTSFTLPDIKLGSIIEYSYTVIAPYHQTFAGGWVFQNEIPKVNSTFYAKIPAFWEYHVLKSGLSDTKPKTVEVIEDCMEVQGAKASCLFMEYSIDHIPAFVEEDFISSRKNYLKRLSFELKKITNTAEEVTDITKSWEDVERDFFEDYYIGRKYGKKRFISKRIPNEIEEEQDELLKAKRVYDFIKNHYTWNRGLGLYYESDYKKAFKKAEGNMAEINMALINALLAVGLDANVTLLSTRNKGFITKLHPVISDFNYMIAQVRIDGKDYYLDAVDKKLTFGMLPFRCLNGTFRVFDKVKGGYWVDFEPKDKAITKVYSIAEILDDATIEMKTRVLHLGYDAYNSRKKIKKLSIDTYKNNFETDHSELGIVTHEINNLNEQDKPLIEMLEFDTEPTLNNSNTLYLSPFVIKEFEKNPFNLITRSYPVDLGYKMLRQHNLSLIIPDGFVVKNLPKSRKMVLPNKGGSLVCQIDSTEDKITINFSFSLDKTIYQPEEYPALKDFIAQLIIAQNEMIILTKK